MSRAECALITGLVQYPSGYNPLQDPQAAKERQLTVLRLMEEAGYLTADERAEIGAEPLRYRSRLFNIQAPHFVIYVEDLLTQQLGVDRLRAGGLRVVTTLDLDLQQQAERAVRHRLDLLNCRTPGLCDEQTNPNRRVDNAAAVVLDNQSGEILAMVGSPNYFDERIQGNVNAALVLRQPGSAIKPLTYAAALDQDWSRQAGVAPLTPATILADLPVTFYVKDEHGGNAPYAPVNYDRIFHGPVSIRTALANSYNIPAVKVLDRIGVTTLQRLAGQAGISTFGNDFGLALTLGGGEVKLLELTAAFGIFRTGTRLTPSAIRTIEGGDEASFVFASPQPPSTPASQPLIAPATAYLITDILSDPVARIPAFGEGSVLELPFPAAVKTGTTTDWRDNWTIGYTTERLVGVWVGNADNTPMLGVSGIDGAGPIWHDIMIAAHATSPPPFVRPANIDEIAICAPSGLLPTPTCPRIRYERFVRGTEPTQADNQFVSLPVDRATGAPVNAASGAETARRVFWLLPPEYHDWMAAQGIPIVNCQLSMDNCSSVRSTSTSTSTMKQANAVNPQAPIHNAQLLILTAPASNTGYQIHPGLPVANQRIEVAGYVADGQPWAELRLVKDGETLAEATKGTRLRTWWTLAQGQHEFWLEGRQQPGDELSTSARALVVVEPFSQATAAVSGALR